MATTTNFDWETPDDTDLVKDGAAAIRTLGSSIDTSMADLLGGTTGQVLAKNSDTDMDFVWSADAAGMTNPMTTTADIIYSSSGSTPARLGIGSTSDVLTVAGGVPTWAAPAGGGKVLQVVQGTTTTQVTVATTTFTDSTLTATITPSSATSKILVLTSEQVSAFRTIAGAGARVRLLRDSTTIWGDSATGISFSIYADPSASALQNIQYFCINYLDSPATTSAVTYKTQGRAETTADSGELEFHKASNSNTIILMEIGA